MENAHVFSIFISDNHWKADDRICKSGPFVFFVCTLHLSIQMAFRKSRLYAMQRQCQSRISMNFALDLFMRVKRYHNSVRLLFFLFIRMFIVTHSHCEEWWKQKPSKVPRRRVKESWKKLSSATSTNATSHNGIMVVVWCAVFFVVRNAKNNAVNKKLSAFVINHIFSWIVVVVSGKEEERWLNNRKIGASNCKAMSMEIDLKNRNE